MEARRLTEQEHERINKKAALVDDNFEQTYRGAYQTKYGKDPDAATLAEACRIYYGENPSAKRTTKNITKQTAPSAAVQKDTNVDKTLMGLPVGWKVERQADASIKVYMPTPDGGFKEVDTDAVDALMRRLAGKGTSSEQMFPTPGAARFPGGDALGRDVTDAPRPQTYGFSEPGLPGVRIGPNFVLANVDPGIAEPMDFDAPEPKDRHDADNADVNRIERTSPVFKSSKVAKGTFAGTACDMSATQPHERNTGR